MTTNAPKIGKIHSLEVAARTLQCAPDTIIEHAAQGAVSLFVSIPDDVVVVSTNRDFLRLNDPATDTFEKTKLRFSIEGRSPKPMTGIKFLELSRSDCSALGTGECNRAIYSSGLLQSSKSHEWENVFPESVRTDRLEGSDLSIGRLFACYSAEEVIRRPTNPSSLKNLPLEISSLRICERDLHILQLRLEASAKPARIPFNDGFIEKEYMSQRLRVFHQAAITFWDPNKPPPSEPKNENVCTWIEQEYKSRTKEQFGKTVATQTVQILRDSYENWSQTDYDAGDKLTPFNILVEVGEVWAQGYMGPDDPYSAQIIEDLISIYNFKPYLADQLNKILRPEAILIDGGRPQKRN